mgnify:CR=1 FL=1
METLRWLLAENDRLHGLVPAQFKAVMGVALEKLDSAFRPGLITVRWTSLGIDKYFVTVKNTLKNFENLVKAVSV